MKHWVIFVHMTDKKVLLRPVYAESELKALDQVLDNVLFIDEDSGRYYPKSAVMYYIVQEPTDE